MHLDLYVCTSRYIVVGTHLEKSKRQVLRNGGSITQGRLVKKPRTIGPRARKKGAAHYTAYSVQKQNAENSDLTI
jgi:hypothetical protein